MANYTGIQIVIQVRDPDWLRIANYDIQTSDWHHVHLKNGNNWVLVESYGIVSRNTMTGMSVLWLYLGAEDVGIPVVFTPFDLNP